MAVTNRRTFLESVGCGMLVAGLGPRSPATWAAAQPLPTRARIRFRSVTTMPWWTCSKAHHPTNFSQS